MAGEVKQDEILQLRQRTSFKENSPENRSSDSLQAYSLFALKSVSKLSFFGIIAVENLY